MSSRGRRARRAGLAAIVAAAVVLPVMLAGGASAAATPVASTGAAVQLVVSGVPTPTSFAWSDEKMFVGDGPAVPSGDPGGLYAVAGGVATKVTGSPDFVYGLAWHYGALYVSTGPTIERMRGWNGTGFDHVTTIWKSKSARFAGFNGLAFGPDGRLYAGLALKEPAYDHAKDPYPLSQAVVSMTASGKDLRIIARGIRQPFQLTFPAGARWPFVSDLGQDAGTIPPDEIVVAKPGTNYGFPSCTWLVLSACKGFDHPRILLPAHASPMGIASAGKTLYVALYSGIGGNGFNPEVVTIPSTGGAPTPLLTGFGVQIIALGIHHDTLYVGNLNGQVYSVPLGPASP